MNPGYINAFFVILIWSGFILVSRIGGQSALLPYDVVALRFGVGAAFLAPMWFWYRFSFNNPRLIAAGLVGGIGYAIPVYIGFHYAPAVHAAILLPGMMPFETALLAWLLLGEKPSRNRVFGLIAIACGVGCLAIENLQGTLETLPGDIAFVTASTLWSLYTVLIRKWQLGAMEATIGNALVSTLLYLPIYLLFLPKQIDIASWQSIALQGFYQGFMAMVVAMILFMKALKALGPSRISLFMAMIPVISGLLAVPVLNEPLSTAILLGLLFTSLGAWIGSRASKLNNLA